MKNLFNSMRNKIYYSMESIKNRYPCKLLKITVGQEEKPDITISFRAATKFDIRESKLKPLLDDGMLVEKFHPTDGVKLGFLSAGEIILNKAESIEDARKIFIDISQNMLNQKIEKEDL